MSRTIGRASDEQEIIMKITYRYLFTRQTYMRMLTSGIVWMAERNWDRVRKDIRNKRIQRKAR